MNLLEMFMMLDWECYDKNGVTHVRLKHVRSTKQEREKESSKS